MSKSEYIKILCDLYECEPGDLQFCITLNPRLDIILSAMDRAKRILGAKQTRWTKWKLLKVHTYRFESKTIEVRRNNTDGRLQFRVTKVAPTAFLEPHFSTDDVEKIFSEENSIPC